MAVATAIAIGGLALSAAGTAGSFIQAGQQRRNQAAAQAAASKALDQARKELMVNTYKRLGIRKEPYQLEREALLAAGAQAIEAGKESERGAAATVGRIQMAQQEAQADVRTSMGQEMQALDKLVAEEDARQAGERAAIDLEEAKGAQLAAAYAQNAQNQAISQGMAGLQAMGQQAQNLIPLYPRQKAPSATDVSRYAAGTPGQPTNYVQSQQPAYPYGTPALEANRNILFDPFAYQARQDFRFYQNTPQSIETPGFATNPYSFEFK